MEESIIETIDLSKRYGKARGIDQVNLEIRKGEIFGFIGPNGAGKSTTIRILLNLIFPSGGSARIMGMDVIRKTKEIKQKTGYIPSDASPYSGLKVNEFLEYMLRFYPVRKDDQRIRDLCERFELDRERKISDLSMGNRKKVSIVQSLLHRPELLILDEPTTGLDPLMQETFFDLLREENRNGMTIFFSSNVLSEVQMLCKRVAIIKEGQIAGVEVMEELRKKQLKKIQIEYSESIYPEDFIPGEEIKSLVTGPGNRVSFMYPGDINRLIGFLKERKITDLTIEEPSLEEIFMHYYRK
jgi:ABC-2 type transport system ATP-binding protein